MAENNIKISGIGDVSRADFLRAITDTDKFREFADQQGWGNKRRQMAWDSLNNYAQGVKNGEINEINDMHQVIDDTGVRTNKKERYNWIGSKFDANGATAAFMNSVAKGMTTKKENTTLKAVPTVSSYLNNLWFGSDTPDWALFQKNDVLTKDKYGITNRMAKLKAGLQSLKDTLTTKGAEYNWDGVDKEKLLSNIDNAINSSNVAAYAPLGITSDYINNVLATKDLSNTIQEQSSENSQTQPDQSPQGITDEQLLAMDANKDLADLVAANPAKRADYIAQARKRLANQIILSEQEAQKNTKAYENQIATQKQQQYNQEMLNWYKSQTFKPEYTAQLEGSYVGTPGGKEISTYLDNLNFSDEDFRLNSPRTVSAIATLTKFKKPEIRTAKTDNGSFSVKLNNKLDVLAYMLQFNAKNNPNFKKYFTDVSSSVNKPKGSIYRIDALKDNNGSYVYVKKNGNNYEFYRSKPMNALYKEYLAKKHKLGGIITKFQQGGAAAYNAKLKQRQQQIQKVKEQQIQSQPQATPTGRTAVKDMGKNTTTLTTADKVAIGAAAADFLASFTANPIANGAGTLLTTGADLASDISHGASVGQAAGNAAMNLGMGLVGFIPGLGTATKAKKLKKILQVSSGAIQAYFIGNNFNEGIKSLSKVLDGSATVQDYKNLIYGLQGAKGASNSVVNASKRKGASKVIDSLPDKFNTGESRYTFKSNGKETQRLTSAQVKELQEKGSEGVSDDIKNLLNGVVIKPKGDKWFNINKKPIEYQYKSKEEIQKTLDDLNIQSQKSSMWNPGKQDYLAMTSEHNWSLPSISLRFGKNSPNKIITRGKQPSSTEQLRPQSNEGASNTIIRTDIEIPKPTPTLTKEQLARQRKSDIDLLTKRFTSDKPLPIDNKTRAVYERFRKRPMTDSEIQQLEREQRFKRYSRASNKAGATVDQLYAEALNARKKELLQQRKAAEEAVQLKADIERAQAELQYARDRRRELQGLYPILRTNSVIPKAPAIRPGIEEGIRAIKEHNARQTFYDKKFSDIHNLSDSEKQVYAEAVRTDNSFRQRKAQEYDNQTKAARRQKSQELIEAFSGYSNNAHIKPKTLPHRQSNKKKKTSRDNNIRRRQDGGILYDYNFLNSVHAFKKGGIIKAKNGIKTNNNIWADNNQDYDYNTYLNRIFENDDVLSWMRTHYNDNNATKAYADYVMKNVNDRSAYGINNYNNSSTYTANNDITTFNTGYQNNGNTLNYTLFGNSSDDYTNKKGVAYNLINFTRPNNAMHTGDSYNIDSNKAYIDNALGLQTYSRVASLTDSNIKSGEFGNWGKYWKDQGNTGAYYYIAPNDTSGKGQWIPTNDKTLNGYQDFETTSKENEGDGSKTNPNENIGKKSIFQKGKEYLSNLTSNPGNFYNAIETGKYLLANKTTNDLAKIKAPNLNISPENTSYQTKDNLSQWNAYTSASAASLNWAAKHPATSSGQLQAAQMHDAMNSVNQNNIKGGVARNTHLDSEADKTYKAGMYTMKSHVDTANANAQYAYKTRMVNEYENPRARLIGLATNRQNWINALEKFNVIDPYVERKNAAQQYGLAKAQWDYSNDVAVNQAYENYRKEIKANENNPKYDASTSDAAKKYREAQKNATAKYYNDMYSIYGIKNPNFQTVTFSKKGGKFEDISKFNTKEFYNTVRHSINTALKQGTDLSKLLISKSTRK